MGKFAENLNLGKRVLPPLTPTQVSRSHQPKIAIDKFDQKL